ncbi:MAG: selenocysteine-specific translation elongation factor [Anaerolineae bacterium]
MRVFGTAGHVDHGKSTLIQMLTGIDPDRLTEEKAREMTIDLGFAWMDLPSGEQIGFVDVPGHRDFVENMLAGVTGVNAVLLVVAANEGIMPQTREHLAILDLIEVEYGVVCLTKIDLVDDEDWLELIEQDIRMTLSETKLTGAKIVRVSSRTGSGIAELSKVLASLSEVMPQPLDLAAPRLPIDRVFTKSGFGTIVTGTLIGGALEVGNEVEILPSRIRARIRGLQSFNKKVDLVGPSRRVAVNLVGVEYSQLKRGDVLSFPGLLQPTHLIDVHFRHLANASRPLKHNDQIKFFAGSTEVIGSVRVISEEELLPGDNGWLQIRTESDIAVAQGDKYILRRPSPSETIGGGVIINPYPQFPHKRFDLATIQSLETLLRGSLMERVIQLASCRNPISRNELQIQLRHPAAEIDEVISSALQQGLLLAFPDDTVISNIMYQQFVQKMNRELQAYHEKNPLRVGMAREELRTRLDLKQEVFSAFVGQQSHVITQNGYVYLSDHEIRFTENQIQAIGELQMKFTLSPYCPPSFGEASHIVGEDVLYALIELGEIVRVQSEMIFWAAIYREILEECLRIIDDSGSIAVNQLRDHFGTTRKYAIGLLEHFDSINVTRRVGDVRIRGT